MLSEDIANMPALRRSRTEPPTALRRSENGDLDESSDEMYEEERRQPSYLSQFFSMQLPGRSKHRSDSEDETDSHLDDMDSSIVDDVVRERGSAVATKLPAGCTITYLGKTNKAHALSNDTHGATSLKEHLKLNPSTKSQAVLLAQFLKEKERRPSEERIKGKHDNCLEQRGLKEFQVGYDDVVDIVEDEQAFSRLQSAVANTGAVTNEMLKQNLHFYAKYHKTRKSHSSSHS